MVEFDRSAEGLRHAASKTSDWALAAQLNWAATEIDRLTEIIEADSGKTRLIGGSALQDQVVRTRVYGILAWHVNREQADLSDHDLALTAFRNYTAHTGRTLIDPNE